MYICHCSLIIDKQPFNGWMAATVVAELVQSLEKTTTLNKKLDQTVPEISNLQREKCFFRNNYFLNHCSFYDLLFCIKIFCALVNNCSDMLFIKVISIGKLEALSCDLSLLKVQR